MKQLRATTHDHQVVRSRDVEKVWEGAERLSLSAAAAAALIEEARTFDIDRDA